MSSLEKIEVYKSGVIFRDWKWRLKAKNGRVLASGRGFNSKANCLQSLSLVKNIFKGNVRIVLKCKDSVKMKAHTKIYFNHFEIGLEDFVCDELEFVENGREVKAADIHHIYFGAGKYDHIDNLMALSRENHNKAHLEKYSRSFLQEVHLKFMEMNPYY